uniref:Ubs_12 putative toxin n=1 Tax=Unedogemmula bisaya TaxID=746885 RepID=A0A098LXZ5_UNEBI
MSTLGTLFIVFGLLQLSLTTIQDKRGGQDGVLSELFQIRSRAVHVRYGKLQKRCHAEEDVTCFDHDECCQGTCLCAGTNSPRFKNSPHCNVCESG